MVSVLIMIIMTMMITMIMMIMASVLSYDAVSRDQLKTSQAHKSTIDITQLLQGLQFDWLCLLFTPALISI